MNCYKKIYISMIILLIIFPIIYSLLGIGFPFLPEQIFFVPKIVIEMGYYIWVIIGMMSFFGFLYMLIKKKLKPSFILYGYIVFIFSGVLGLYSMIIYDIVFGSFHL